MTDDEPRAADVGEAQFETRRRVLDADGRRWTVREYVWPTMDRRMGRSLIFECDDIMRRVRVFPRDWYQLSDEALYRLSLGV